jgi:exopolysaccharide production protein ExoQ
MTASRAVTTGIIERESQRAVFVTLLSCFGFLVQFRVAFAYLFFAWHPAYGTLAGALAVAFFVAITALLLLFDAPDQFEVHLPKLGRAFLVFLGWSGVTIFWTLATSKTVAGMYWAVMCMEAAYVYALCRFTGTDRGVRAFLMGWFYGGTAVAVCALILQPRSEGGTRLGDLLLLHPNLLGNTCAVSLLVGAYLLLTSKKRATLIVATALQAATLVLTLSKTSMLALLIACGFLFLRLRLSLRQRFIAGFSFLLVFLISYSRVSDYVISYLVEQQGGEALDTFTGRTVLWTAVLDMIPERLWFGHGFLSFRDVGPQIFEGIPVVHAHNEALMLVFTLGIIGVGLGYAVYVCVFIAMKRLGQSSDGETRTFGQMGIALLVYYLIRGFAEASQMELVMPSVLIMTLFIYAAHHFEEHAIEIV